MQNGHGIKAYPIRLVFLKSTEVPEDINQLAISVPKRKFKKAVDRNRIKRLVRESYRLQKQTLADHNIKGYAILAIWLNNEMPNYKDVDSKFTLALQKMIKSIQKELKSSQE